MNGQKRNHIHSENLPCTVSIIIKALNEEKRIATAIESAIQAVESIGGEVILADSFSTDQTIKIAKQYPIQIVQLANPNDRCCGIGPQLGYQHAQGEFIYILDGDMQILEHFLAAAVDFMQQNPEVGGVGGKVIEMNTDSLEFQARTERASHHMQAGTVDRLDMGGLYRKTAIKSVNYFSDRNLHSYEELDLAVRLRAQGWKLCRIDTDAVRHWGHDSPPYQLLIKRWKSSYINGLGEIIRGALGKPHLKLILNDVKELRIYLAVIGWWIALILIPWLSLDPVIKSIVWLGLLTAPLALMSFKKKSIKKALYSVISWNFNAAGLIRGFLSPRSSQHNIHSNCILPNLSE